MELHETALQLSADTLPFGWEPVQSSVHAKVARNQELSLYYKEFLPRGPTEGLKSLLRRSRATRARRNGDALLGAGINAPQNIAWGKLKGGREYLFTGALPGEGADTYLEMLRKNSSAESRLERWQFLEALGAFIGEMHAAGFIHGDLRPGNILVSLTSEGLGFALIDNERTYRYSCPPGKRLLKNLMQLNMLPADKLSRSERLRFFHAWHRQLPELSQLEASILAKEAYHWATRRLQRKHAT